MAGWDERKLEILELVTDHPGVTAADLADALGISVTNASERLRCYHLAGDLDRQRWHWGCQGRPSYRYRISDKGLDKLSYLGVT